MKVLMIDDNSVEFDMFKAMLKKIPDHGLEVTFKIDPFRAIWCFQDNEFDVVITDYQMPEINGGQILKKIKEIDPKFPVIVRSHKSMIYENFDGRITKTFLTENKDVKMMVKEIYDIVDQFKKGIGHGDSGNPRDE